MNIQDLIDDINKLNKGNKVFVIAIDGRSGSGKSSLAKILKKRLNNASVVHLDTYDMYNDGDASAQRVVDKVLEPLKKTEENKLLIVEGIFALNFRLLPHYDYKIWIECPEEIGFERGLKRDIDLNGIDNSEKWTNYWIPKEREYISKEKPQEKADVVIDGTAEFK